MPHALMTDMQSAALLDDWTFEEDKTLEGILAECWGAADRVDLITAKLPKRDAAAVRDRLCLLEEDISNIEAGLIPLPDYPADVAAAAVPTRFHHHAHQCHPFHAPPPAAAGPPPPARPAGSAGGAAAGSAGGGSAGGAHAAAAGVEPRKGVPWSEEEHRLFLLGLAKFGKGDWRSISRHFVVSRTPTQVASHAQKYFIRLTNASKKEKRRSSIHDITSPGGSGGGGGGGGGGGSGGGADPAPGSGRLPADVQRAMQADLAAAGVSLPAAAAAALAAAQGMPLSATAGYTG